MADDQIEEHVRKNSAFFTSLIELIPARHYLPNDALPKNSFPDLASVSGKTAREVKKRLTKKAKFLKLDPGKHKSVTELQKEIEKKEKELQFEDSEETLKKPIKVNEISSLPIDHLRQKLHDKLESMRGKRKIKDVEKGSDRAKKRKLDKQVKKKKKKDENLKATDSIKNIVRNEKKAAEVVNNNGEVVFSKFDFAGSKTKKKKSKGNVEDLLKKAEKRETTLKILEEEDKSKADMLKTKLKWGKALKQAEGEKVKDDPKLLLKTLKKKKKLKEISKKKWDDRISTQKKQQEEKQKLRKKHLQERKKGVKTGKKQKPNKKGQKHKPGF